MKYTANKIAEELIKTAQGDAYYGNALYVARDFHCITCNDYDCLNRWIFGNQRAGDSIRLMDIANEIIKTEEAAK